MPRTTYVKVNQGTYGLRPILTARSDEKVSTCFITAFSLSRVFFSYISRSVFHSVFSLLNCYSPPSSSSSSSFSKFVCSAIHFIWSRKAKGFSYDFIIFSIFSFSSKSSYRISSYNTKQSSKY